MKLLECRFGRGDVVDYWRLVVLSVVVGSVAGLGAAGLYWLIDAMRYLLMEGIAGYHPQGPGGEPPLFAPLNVAFRREALLVLPAAGGLLGGWLVANFAPEAAGHGTDAAIEAYHYHDGRVRGRVPIIKAIASAITIGSGGSAGREGPIAQIGAGFGSQLAKWLSLSGKDRRILMAAGMAGGVGAIFNAPLAGAIFAAEVMYRDLDFEYEVLVPAIISSVVAYAVFTIPFGWEPLFVTPAFAFRNIWHLLPYLPLALVVSGGSLIYVKVFYKVHHLFGRSRIQPWLKPALGGLVVGLIGYFIPETLGAGAGILQRALVTGHQLESDFGGIGIRLLLLVAFGKILTTAFSVGSGGSGGVFGPAIVIGGALGGVVGQLTALLFPALDIQPGAFVLVGMAGFFAAAANTPISTIIMVSEMTGNYHLLVPSMLVCFLSYLMLRHVQLYEKQLPNRFDAPVHLAHMMEATLRQLTVADVPGWSESDTAGLLINDTDGVGTIRERFTSTARTTVPVVDKAGKLCGVIYRREMQAMLMAHSALGPLVLATDFAQPAVTVCSTDYLLTALQKLTAHDIRELVVVDPADQRKIIGVITNHNIMAAYHRRATEEKAA